MSRVLVSAAACAIVVVVAAATWFALDRLFPQPPAGEFAGQIGSAAVSAFDASGRLPDCGPAVAEDRPCFRTVSIWSFPETYLALALTPLVVFCLFRPVRAEARS